jgi:uncharacterized membrane protein YhfC
MDLAFRPAVFVALATSALIALVGPPAAGWWWNRKSRAPWSAWGWGLLVFFVAQGLLRLPWQIPLGIVLGPHLQGHAALATAWIATSALTAAIWEECGRYAGYRWLLKRERSFRVGVMFGLGHGGLEAMVVGVSVAVSAALYAALGAHAHLGLPPEAHDKLVTSLSAIGPGDALAAALERMMAVLGHVAMSLLVLQVFTRGSKTWLLAAVAFHFAADFVGVEGAVWLKDRGGLVKELAVVPTALAAVAVIAWLRRR